MKRESKREARERRERKEIETGEGRRSVVYL